MLVTIKPVLFSFLLLMPFMAKNRLVPHPLHVSTTDISYNAETKKLETICTIFTDDFELAIAKQFNAKVDLQKPEMHNAMDALVKKYVEDHLQLRTNNTPVSLYYLGFQVNHEAIDVYIESAALASPKKVGVEVSLLHNIFNDQINIVHITVGGVRKSGKINYPDKKIEQVF